MSTDQLLEQQHAQHADDAAILQQLTDEQWQELDLQQPSFLDGLLMVKPSHWLKVITDAIGEGNFPALKALAAIKKMEAIADIATNKDPKKNRHSDLANLLHSYVQDALMKQPDTQFYAYGATFKKMEAGVRYDYSQCGDPKLVELEAAAKAATDALKQRQAFLQTLPADGMVVTDEETGETYKIYRPAKSSTSTVAVSFK